MDLLKAKIQNFGSYDTLSLDFTQQGLTLVYGATGSGKSTLQDITSWILFGTTGKNGTVDDIRPWTSDKVTKGELTINLNGTILTIVRQRGKASENDLHYSTGAEPIRGKDITSTQQMLSQLLGVDAELYNIASYYNEYSPTRNFFDSNAKQRRELFDQLADLSLPLTLSEVISADRKTSKKTWTTANEELNKRRGKLDGLVASEKSAKRDAEQWEEEALREVEETQIKAENFEKEKASKIQALQTKSDVFEQQKEQELAKNLERLQSFDIKGVEIKCATCGQTNAQRERLELKIDSIISSNNDFTTQIEAAQKAENYHLIKLAELKDRLNPYTKQIGRYQDLITGTETLVWSSEQQVTILEHRLNSLAQLAGLNTKLRSELLKQAIRNIEYATNLHLEKHFDAELRIQLTLGDSDNLEVLIFKNGHECNFRQLSKGQKGLLKLCFSISVMKASADKAGVHFNTLFFDEALDGMDEILKSKAYNLFSELELNHENVFVIEHSPSLQSLFFRKFHVRLEEDQSKVHIE